MKYLMKALFAVFIALSVMAAAVADVAYPYTNPTYIPSAVLPAQTVSAPTTIVLTNNGLGVVAVDIRGTCTSLAAAFQGTVDGTNYTTVNMYPITAGTVTPASAVSAVGSWRTNAAAFRKVRINITALTASCTFTMVGSQQSFGNLF